MDFQDKLIDLTYLEQSFGKGMIPELLNLYKSQVPEFTEDVQEYFDQQDWYSLSRVAHKIKGSWGIVGNRKYFDMFRNLQLVCEAMHLHILKGIQKERLLNEQEQKVYDEIGARGIGENSELDTESINLLNKELERFKNGEKLITVPEYAETTLHILKNSIQEVDELLTKF
ncbi:MAG: Hpt domain-containing protein [Bacteroidales bacterium]|nr:Hpt domain-containing protein [Bacteroidales bacterium]